MRYLLDSNEYKQVCKYFEQMDFTNAETYKLWLAQTYYFVCHSVRLTAFAAAKLPIDDLLSERMLEHIDDEKAHHLLALHDLKNMKGDIKNYPALGLTKAFVESQYYKIMFDHPHHLLGQILMLEALPTVVGDNMYKKVTQAFGKNIASFVKVHAYEDQKHIEKAFEVCQLVKEENLKGIEENFFQACEVYYAILKEIKERTSLTQQTELSA